MTKTFLTLTLLIPFALSSAIRADDNGTLIFSDDFERTESQEITDEVGNGWGTNSKSRAGGHKQVDLKNGAMHIKMHPTADHAVSVTHPAEFRDGVVELRFMLENDTDRLGLDFADLKFKGVHAGHLFKVDVTTKFVQINDMKSGNMNMKFYDAKKAKELTAEQLTFLKTTIKKFPTKIAQGEWHELTVRIVGEQVTASVDGTEVAKFTAPGFAHPTKRMLRLAVPHSAVVDDVKIYSLAN
ncbi:family 16 glycoside hydrolase [Allorhodopirellula heiligendammensis]|uniref:3-keto-alpha-glucoside-1,2-lyase/3-keto-2-hydroxy-glucal hydratase domain-containing protein n=1 Tax=Allorhodopirellula heiligendammensis TaxID=2714739 RepID=A0A5C6BY91_9BACT|nr:family 16 glycoside hydrolase [Allorhodopirellula heiligendammensis]TWU16945.1 hypothetical protein Poly21_41540 [Allorhodopirellula heiligendammensis]